MTIKMTSKHQITIPKQITDALGLAQGAIFDVQLKRGRIELIPLELTEKAFNQEDYAKMDELVTKEKGLGKKVTDDFIKNLKKGVVK